MSQSKLPKAMQALMKRAAAKPSPSLGTVGRYQLLEEVGNGGHGSVYRAVDSESSQVVAIKILHEHVTSEDLQLRMKREAYAMQQLAGTCAVGVHECAQTSSGQLYLVMEFLDGQDLEALLESHAKQGQLLPPAQMFQLLDPVVSTLAFAHARGIIHRDLKPENIFVLRSGGTRLVDFGLVKDLNLAKLTEAGTVAGSPAYIAPEAWAGAPDKLDHHIDVYALGVLAFRILAGRRPFEPGGNLLDFVLAVTSSARPSLHALRPDLHPSIDAWAARALALQPQDRFHGVGELWETLRGVLAQSPGR